MCKLSGFDVIMIEVRLNSYLAPDTNTSLGTICRGATAVITGRTLSG